MPPEQRSDKAANHGEVTNARELVSTVATPKSAKAFACFLT